MDNSEPRPSTKRSIHLSLLLLAILCAAMATTNASALVSAPVYVYFPPPTDTSDCPSYYREHWNTGGYPPKGWILRDAQGFLQSIPLSCGALRAEITQRLYSGTDTAACSYREWWSSTGRLMTYQQIEFSILYMPISCMGVVAAMYAQLAILSEQTRNPLIGRHDLTKSTGPPNPALFHSPPDLTPPVPLAPMQGH